MSCYFKVPVSEVNLIFCFGEYKLQYKLQKKKTSTVQDVFPCNIGDKVFVPASTSISRILCQWGS